MANVNNSRPEVVRSFTIQLLRMGDVSMAGQAAEGHILGIKKLGGLLLVILGCLLIAAAVSAGYTGLSVAGGVLVALGVVLLVLKIVRRNRPA
jgi:Flp pilus assembly protein TadB